MLILRRVLLIALALVVAAAAWLWWNRPQKVDMAAYVPADTLVYAEAESLPELARGLTSTDAWRALAPAFGLKTDYGRFGWPSRVAAWAGVGPAEVVVFARAQVAVAVLSIGTSEEPQETLKITPRLALVAETHTGGKRVLGVLERLAGDFARRTYGSPRVERAETDGATYVTWTSPEDGRRKIVAAVSETVAVVGNDRAAVDACLAVRRGERPALAGDPQLFAMRERLKPSGALAFSYVSAEGTQRLFELVSLAYLGQSVTNPQMQSLAASQLPKIGQRLLGVAAWRARLEGGAVEEEFFISLREGLGGRLAEAVGAGEGGAGEAAALLPPGVYQLTRYNTRDPEAAWRGLMASLSAQFDVVTALFLGRSSDALLTSYGVEEPQAFLRAAGPWPATARLDDEGASTVMVVEVRDRAALEREVRRHLGGARTEEAGGATLLVSTDAERGAAAFVGRHLITGEEDDLRRCLEARAAAKTLAASDDFKQASRGRYMSPPAAAVTLTDDREAARAFVSYFARGGAAQTGAAHAQIPPARAYAVTESRFVADGYERRTLSSFGSFGTLLARLSPGRE